VVKFI